MFLKSIATFLVGAPERPRPATRALRQRTAAFAVDGWYNFQAEALRLHPPR